MSVAQTERINGYIVVRSPEHNFDYQKRAYFLHSPPFNGKVYYGGVDRMPWNEIDEDYYDGKLPKDITLLRAILERENEDFSSLFLNRSLDAAKALLDYSNSRKPLNELIVIHSSRLNDQKGEYECPADSVTWLGYDPFCYGSWSLLSAGIFVVPGLRDFANKLNKHGLFSDPEIIERYADYYKDKARQNVFEDLPTDEPEIIPIRVGRYNI